MFSKELFAREPVRSPSTLSAPADRMDIAHRRSGLYSALEVRKFVMAREERIEREEVDKAIDSVRRTALMRGDDSSGQGPHGEPKLLSSNHFTRFLLMNLGFCSCHLFDQKCIYFLFYTLRHIFLHLPQNVCCRVSIRFRFRHFVGIYSAY